MKGAGGGTRTHKPLRAMVFETIAYTVPPRRLMCGVWRAQHITRQTARQVARGELANDQCVLLAHERVMSAWRLNSRNSCVANSSSIEVRWLKRSASRSAFLILPVEMGKSLYGW